MKGVIECTYPDIQSITIIYSTTRASSPCAQPRSSQVWNGPQQRHRRWLPGQQRQDQQLLAPFQPGKGAPTSIKSPCLIVTDRTIRPQSHGPWLPPEHSSPLIHKPAGQCSWLAWASSSRSTSRLAWPPRRTCQRRRRRKKRTGSAVAYGC